MLFTNISSKYDVYINMLFTNISFKYDVYINVLFTNISFKYDIHKNFETNIKLTVMYFQTISLEV